MKKLIYLCAVSLLVMSCAKGNNSDPIQNVTTASQDKDLQAKNFQSNCSPKPVDAILTGVITGLSATVKSASTVYRFEGANMTRTTHFYASTDCTGDETIRFVESGNFTLHTDQRSGDGGKAIDFNYETLTVTTMSNDGVTVANAVHLCSATDWSVNSQRDETANAKETTCLGAQMPRHDANLYRVDSDNLFLGAQPTTTTTPDERPQSLDLGTQYRAQ